MKSVLLLCVVAAALLGNVCSQNQCTLPTATDISTLIAQILNSAGGEGTGIITVNVISFHFTCIAASTVQNRVSRVSVAVVYERNETSGVSTHSEQFQFMCNGDVITVASGAREENPPPEAFNVTTRRDCFTCAMSGPPEIFDNVTNCAICPNCQTLGQGFCINILTQNPDCCPFYQGGVCVDNCTDNRTASAASNFVCVCKDGFAENNGVCEDVCDPNPCQNNGTCSFVGNNAVCSCPSGFTGVNCETVFVPEPPSSTPTPSATPVTSPPATSRPCPDNCQQCNSNGCCIQCENSFELSRVTCPECVPTVCPNGCSTCFNSTCCRECQQGYDLVISGNTCTCNDAKPTEPPTVVCSVPNCTTCNLVDGRPCCTDCQDGFTENECQCSEIRVSDPAGVAAGIAIGVVLFVLILVALAILAAYLIYAFVTHGTDSKRTKTHMPFGNGDAHDNPLYINPKELDDDEP